MAKRDCAAMDWSAVGRVDAELNRSVKMHHQHFDACGERFDEAAWRDGFRTGSNFRCTSAGAYFAGKNGEAFPNLCPDSALLNPPYQEGVLVRRKRQDLSEASQALSRARDAELKKSQQKTSFTQALGRALFPREPESARLTDYQNQLENEITEMEKKYPPPPSVQRSDSMMGYNTLGALGGTAIGFGVGHAIQGRYSRRGWVYTLTEIGSLFLPGGVAVAAFLGLKVTESVDVWNYNYQQSMGYPVPH